VSRRGLTLGLVALAGLALVPALIHRDDVLNFLFLVLISVTLEKI
jgi:hypothetical protein